MSPRKRKNTLKLPVHRSSRFLRSSKLRGAVSPGTMGCSIPPCHTKIAAHSSLDSSGQPPNHETHGTPPHNSNNSQLFATNQLNTIVSYAAEQTEWCMGKTALICHDSALMQSVAYTISVCGAFFLEIARLWISFPRKREGRTRPLSRSNTRPAAVAPRTVQNVPKVIPNRTWTENNANGSNRNKTGREKTTRHHHRRLRSLLVRNRARRCRLPPGQGTHDVIVGLCQKNIDDT